MKGIIVIFGLVAGLFLLAAAGLFLLVKALLGKRQSPYGSVNSHPDDAYFHSQPGPGDDPLSDAENSPLSRAAKAFGADGSAFGPGKKTPGRGFRQDADFSDEAYGDGDRFSNGRGRDRDTRFLSRPDDRRYR